jgi:putative ABC transport system substrate-binding protein
MGISRRICIAAVLAGTLGAAGRASGQGQLKQLRVGVLVNGAPGTPLTEAVLKVLREGFAAQGYEEGRNLSLTMGYAQGQLDRLPAIAKDMADSGVDMVFALGGPAARAAANATTTTPVVFAIVTDPVALGLVKSMQAPGGNVTGVTNLDPGQAAAQMALLKEAAPSVTRVAILSEAGIPGADSNGHAPIDRDNLQAAAASGLHVSLLKLKGPKPDLQEAFAALAAQGVQAVVALEVPLVLSHRERIATLATSNRMVSMFPGGTADAGAVLTFGTTVADAWKRMPAIADRIVKGSPPAVLPVEAVTRRELVVNLRIAKEIGLELPQPLLDRADRKLP